MFEIIALILFLLLGAATLRLTFRVAWGVAKLIAIVLFMVAIPALIGCLLLAGGFLLLIPLALVGIAFGILRICL